MPIPLGNRVSSAGQHHFERASVSATHTKLIKIYQKCGSFLHIPKPFTEDYESHITNQRNRYRQATDIIRGYSKYFKDLLWNHAAIGLEYSGTPENLEALEKANRKTAWLVDFEESESNSVSIVLARAT